MPITTLDPKAALVVIDMQKGIVGTPTEPPIGPVIANAAALTSAFRARGLPVVLVNVAGGAPGRVDDARPRVNPPADWTDLIPELGAEDSDLLVTKHAWGAFLGTDLAARLHALGVTQIVLTGVATSIGVESTAREAYALGFNVALATDAMADRKRALHEHSVNHLFPRLGETGTTADILALLARSPQE